MLVQTSDLAHQDGDITTISQRVLDIKSLITGHASSSARDSCQKLTAQMGKKGT
jgi:hypothetical protein